MQVVWSEGPVTADRLRAHLMARVPWKNSTIRTMLRRLEEKGYVKHTVQGRTYVYSAAVRPKSVAMRAVQADYRSILRGSAEELLVGLVVQRGGGPGRVEAARRTHRRQQNE